MCLCKAAEVRRLQFLEMGTDLMALSFENSENEGAATLWQEPFRPQFHFSPVKNWINDPNGLVYFKGEYHLFFQYNPYGKKWGHMSWGHAVSTDLVHWRELDVAIPETDHMAFSGCALVDWHNTSGLGDGKEPPLLAYYTAFDEAADRQSQHVAYSHDQGRTWMPYEHNPVLDLDKDHFRDPQVFWYAPGRHWVLIVALPQDHKIQIYTSDNLLSWTLQSEFGPFGNTGGQWECPNLCEVPVEGTDHTRWVLKIDVDKNLIGSGSGAQYFVGDFDGKRFTALADDQAPIVRLADSGADFYAAITWSDLPETHDHPVWIGWMSNHQSGAVTPTDPWRGSMTVPRELFLWQDGEAYHLGQRPVQALELLRQARRQYPDLVLSVEESLDLGGMGPNGAVEVLFDLKAHGTGSAGIKLAGDQGDHIAIGFDAGRNEVFVDRYCAGVAFHPDYPARHTCPLTHGEKVSLRILIDAASIELFVGGGRYVITDAHFLRGEKTLCLFAGGGDASFANLHLHELASIHDT